MDLHELIRDAINERFSSIEWVLVNFPDGSGGVDTWRLFELEDVSDLKLKTVGEKEVLSFGDLKIVMKRKFDEVKLEKFMKEVIHDVKRELMNRAFNVYAKIEKFLIDSQLPHDRSGVFHDTEKDFIRQTIRWTLDDNEIILGLERLTVTGSGKKLFSDDLYRIKDVKKRLEKTIHGIRYTKEELKFIRVAKELAKVMFSTKTNFEFVDVAKGDPYVLKYKDHKSTVLSLNFVDEVDLIRKIKDL